MKVSRIQFDTLAVGTLFWAAGAIFMKIGPALDPHIKRIPEQPSNARCLTGERKGHHCTFGPRVPVVPVKMRFVMR